MCGNGTRPEAVEHDRDEEALVADHARRSGYLRHLTRTLSRAASPHRGEGAPRVIVQFWDDPAGVPTDVAQCMRSWKALEDHGFRREVYGDASARSFIKAAYGDTQTAAFDACPHPAMRSDYFRLCYLASQGGFYVDADDVYQGSDWRPLFRDSQLRLQALCYDTTTHAMVDPQDAVAAEENCATRIHYINNNPIIAPARHPVVLAALEASTAAILGHRGGPFDIQSVTGPGNLTACLARYALSRERLGQPVDVEILCTWDAIAVSRWPLSYRSDERNWRLWRQDP